MQRGNLQTPIPAESAAPERMCAALAQGQALQCDAYDARRCAAASTRYRELRLGERSVRDVHARAPRDTEPGEPAKSLIINCRQVSLVDNAKHPCVPR